jgi:hypothetical protein
VSDRSPSEQELAANGNGYQSAASLAVEETPDLASAQPAAQQTTWAPIDLGPILAGEADRPVPEMLGRTDHRCLLYAGRVHALHAEPEALKTWLALKACHEEMLIDRPVLYVDFEDSAPSIVSRLLALKPQISPERVARWFIYVRPDEALSGPAVSDLDTVLAQVPSLAVLDGVTEAYSQQNLSPLDIDDVAQWLKLLPRRLVRAGAAVLLLDHVVKDRENRGRYAIGSQHKLAGVDVAYSLRVIEPFGRGRDGQVAIKVEKDRPGGVREFAAGSQVALMRAISDPEDGSVEILLDPPEQQGETFRPTVLMERAWKVIDGEPGLSMRGVRQATTGHAEHVDLAVRRLVEEGYVERREDGATHRYYPLKSFSQTDRALVSQPCPSVSGRGVAETVSPCPTPTRGDTDTTRHKEHESDRGGATVPRCSCVDGGDEPTEDGRCSRCWGAL